MYKIGSFRLQLLYDSPLTWINESWLGGYKKTAEQKKNRACYFDGLKQNKIVNYTHSVCEIILKRNLQRESPILRL